MSLAFLGYTLAFGYFKDARMARKVLLFSVAYLPLILILLVADHAVRGF
jgi:heme O synthase-like polyprenyltransferase